MRKNIKCKDCKYFKYNSCVHKSNKVYPFIFNTLANCAYKTYEEPRILNKYGDCKNFKKRCFK